jgi:hypothetical protein
MFFAIFILEGFSPSFSWQSALIHLIMTIFVAGISFLAWKKPRYGGICFIILGLLYTVNFSGSGITLAKSVILAFPIITGVLFILQSQIEKH